MFSPFVISLLVAISASVWIYSKYFARRTGGGNARPAVIGSVVTGLIIFIVVFLTLSTVLKK